MMLDLLVSFNRVVRLNGAKMLDDVEFEAIRGTFISILRTSGGPAAQGPSFRVPTGQTELPHTVPDSCSNPAIRAA